MNRLTVQVVIDGAIGSFDKRYSYFVPENLSQKAFVGCRVTVPFGNGNIKKQGIILDVFMLGDNPKIKYIIDITDDTPIINCEMIKLCEFMKERFFCTYYDAVSSILPVGLKLRLENFFAVNEEFSLESALDDQEREIYDYIKLKGNISEKALKSVFDNAAAVLFSLKEKSAVVTASQTKRTVGDKTLKYVRISDAEYDLSLLTPRQREIVDVINSAGSVSIKELMYFTGVSMSVILGLQKKNIITVYEKQIFRTPYKIHHNSEPEKIVLNSQQEAVYNSLKSDMFSGKERVSLLYGITGSGKTSVYMKLAEDCVNAGHGVIVMVPEIALTPQVIELFSHRFGNKIAVFHSAMSLGERTDEYNRIKLGRAKIAIGTRSAVFAPFDDLGLIIMDEEQEHTYKSEKSPRYNARDVAKFRANYHKCMLLLASATPSLESYSSALNGTYGLYELTERYGTAKLPRVSVVDMKKESECGNKGSISRFLADEIEKSLKNNKQVIILLNRRGHNTHISCPQCGYVAKCKECSVSLTYHSANNRLMCHYCGHSEPLPHNCPECGNEYLSFQGVGTQKLAEELKLLFPDAKVLRMDADSTLAKDSYSVNLKAFSDKQYDIMIGTQMVAKGLDFPDVELVGVIGADRAFYSDDYRGFERTFSLLTQVVGRAGRSGGESMAVIQTLNPEDSVIPLAANQDYKAFYNEEVMTRKLMIYPPFCDICIVVTTSKDKETASNISTEILESIKENLKNDYADLKLIILGPMPASIVKVNGRYRYRMIIKCKNSKRFRDMLRKSIDIKQKKDSACFIDINPETII